jgi:hypothetical protein
MIRWLKRLLGISDEDDPSRDPRDPRDVDPLGGSRAPSSATSTGTRPAARPRPVARVSTPPKQENGRQKPRSSEGGGERQSSVPLEPQSQSPRPSAGRGPAKTTASPKRESASRETKPRLRDPHFVQVGLDFGTAFLKCVCRDVIKDEAWVYRNQSSDSALPFLVPATVFSDGKTVSRNGRAKAIPLPSPKMLLRAVAGGDWSASVLREMPAWCNKESEARRAVLARAFAVYHLADALADIRENIKLQIPDFGQQPQDFVAINMAIPVADAQLPKINEAFRSALVHAWHLSAHHCAGDDIDLRALVAVVERDPPTAQESDQCFVYPEVGANVQGFARSRVSEPGIYLMSDTGAGTVDQSVFILHRHGLHTQLTYLAAWVSMLGSGEIERRAVALDPSLGIDALSQLRLEKEQGRELEPFSRVRGQLVSELERETIRVLALAKKKLYVPAQLHQAKILFAGGGHTDFPYAEGVRLAFRSNIFPTTITPLESRLPRPKDLKLKPSEGDWMSRLTVAYGLSFIRAELLPFTYPVEQNDVNPRDLWRRRDRVVAPTKDDC